MNLILNTNKYLIYLFISICLFLIYHLLIWTFFTSQIFDPKNNTSVGDLGRLSYQINLLHNRELIHDLNKSFIYDAKYNNQKIDIITIGDSFSNAGSGGRNPYYQDYIASIYNKNVLNINTRNKTSSFETILGLYNSGYLKKTRPEAIIIESVTRKILERYSRDQDQDIIISEPSITSKLFKVQTVDTYLINTGNYKLPYYTLMYKFKKNANRKVYKFKLNKRLFSANPGTDILFFDRGINSVNNVTQEGVIKVNNNFNYLAKKLETLNIKLYFMACSDKYDLYYNYLQDNTHPRNTFFDLMEPLKKEYYFVNTKKILLPLLDKGIRDIYYLDDTHWTYKASKAVIEDKIFKDNLKKELD